MENMNPTTLVLSFIILMMLLTILTFYLIDKHTDNKCDCEYPDPIIKSSLKKPVMICNSCGKQVN